MRTGWCDSERNALRIARQAEAAGVQWVTVHGRTREQGYRGQAEYDTIAAVKAGLRIPVVANGDIDSPAKARAVLRATGADAVMIGRAAQGQPWIFRRVAHHLATGEDLPPPTVIEVREALLAHLHEHYSLYGEYSGVRSARKHIAWYVHRWPGGAQLRTRINQIEDAAAQWQAVADYMDELASRMARVPQTEETPA
jgi:tRNA-dihydrouridine synthase B